MEFTFSVTCLLQTIISKLWKENWHISIFVYVALSVYESVRQIMMYKCQQVLLQLFLLLKI